VTNDKDLDLAAAVRLTDSGSAEEPAIADAVVRVLHSCAQTLRENRMYEAAAYLIGYAHAVARTDPAPGSTGLANPSAPTETGTQTIITAHSPFGASYARTEGSPADSMGQTKGEPPR
jgi:hypothetical protein